MSDFADELLHRITGAREALRQAREGGEDYAARVYIGELDSLFRLANENGIPIPPEPESTTEPAATEGTDAQRPQQATRPSPTIHL